MASAGVKHLSCSIYIYIYMYIYRDIHTEREREHTQFKSPPWVVSVGGHPTVQHNTCLFTGHISHVCVSVFPRT